METLANLFLAMILGIPLVGGATIAQKQEGLCKAMGGVFTPQPTTGIPYNTPNVCVGGQWINLVRHKPAPQ